MRARTFLGIIIIAFLVAVVGLFAYELYSFVTPAQAPSSPVTEPATPTVVASPSPEVSPTPTIGQAITQVEKNIFDPITALLNFAAVSLIAILVIFLFQRIWHLTGISNLVLDAFNNATGKDDVSKLLPGLNGLTRERLARVLEEVRTRINSNRQSEKKDQEEFRLNKFPVPQQASDEQLSKLLTSLKDVSAGNVSTTVQLMSLIFTPRGTKVTVTLQSKAETPATLGISLEVMDLEGRQETKLRTIWEPAYAPESKSNPAEHKAQAALAKVKQSRPPAAHKDALPFYTLGQFYEQRGALDEARVQYENALTKQPDYEAAQEAFKRVLGKGETIEDRYLNLIEPAARWLAIELSRRSLEESEQRIGQRIKLLFERIRHHSKREQRPNYQAQLYNFIGSFHLASAFTYQGGFFYQEAIDHFKQAITFDNLWFQPYENLADTYVMQLEEWLLGKRSLLSAYLALPSMDQVNQNEQPLFKGNLPEQEMKIPLPPSAQLAWEESSENLLEEFWSDSIRSFVISKRIPWSPELLPGSAGAQFEGKMDGHILPAIERLYEALTNYRMALEYYELYGYRLCPSPAGAQNNAADPIRRRIQLGICTAQLLTADVKLIDKARAQITEMEDVESRKDDVFLYNLACWHAIAHKLYTLGVKYDIDRWKILSGDADPKCACTVLGYSLARNKARDLWKLALDDPCFAGIFERDEYERLVHTLSLKMYELPTLCDLEGDQFKKEVGKVFDDAAWPHR